MIRLPSDATRVVPVLPAQWICFFLLWFSTAFVLAAEDYHLGGGDTVSISVYEQPDLAIVTRVSQDDGTITFPLIGEVTVAGLSPEEAGRKIERLLENGGYIRGPQVRLEVSEFFSHKISIMGQINKPGEYLLKGESRVADLITQAGGLQDDAADIIFLIKKDKEGKSTKHQIDVLRFYEGDMGQNIQVSKGELILVPKMDMFYVHGEVKRPGGYRLERGMTVMQAISVGGGITGRGSLKRIQVTRQQPDGTSKKTGLDLTDQLQPDDVLYVKERLF